MDDSKLSCGVCYVRYYLSCLFVRSHKVLKKDIIFGEEEGKERN